MTILNNFLLELDSEAAITRKFLERIPAGKDDWRPHEKSMPLKKLAGHIAELPGWIAMALTTGELDAAAGTYQSPQFSSNAELLNILDHSVAEAKQQLSSAREKDLLGEWVLRNGQEIYLRFNKGGLIRHAFSQLIHHRAQLGVYLRLLDVPVPGSYGPSADEPKF